ncbi:MAG: hypothetical protein L6R39_003285 [Caloplaca ligustica]|nr:MAG: hypothetical protein L6R39_003285 [Caloplaca ligustica]
MHHYIPSHVVDCDHSHDGPPQDGPDKHHHGAHSHHNGHASTADGDIDEHSPLLAENDHHSKSKGLQRSMSATGEFARKHHQQDRIAPTNGRPSLQTRVSKLVSGAKTDCNGDGRCYGYSDPCARECFKAISRNPMQVKVPSQPRVASHPGLLRTATAPYARAVQIPLDGFDEEDHTTSAGSSPTITPGNAMSKPTFRQQDHHHDFRRETSPQSRDLKSTGKRTSFSASSQHDDTQQQQQHHHHVPTNGFLSIGLQTSIAIALHKLPEGFITFATNHANPKLGFAVFMALFIHNITEGFAMALPLYLAINSRWKAMFWSSLLGGASQPFGAGVAALWFKVAGRSDKAPGETVYGCMFAITAGIMASVALQLFAESLALNHNRNICLTFAFIGMGILGVSFALTA